MVTLEKLREDMNTLLQVDKNLHFVEVNADTIDEALADAVVQLDTKLAHLHYEVVEKGSDGILGLGKKPWKIMVYQDPKTVKKATRLASEGLFDMEEEGEEAKIINRDGLYYIRHFKSDIMLKVLLPVGEGLPIELKDVIDADDYVEALLVRSAEKAGAFGVGVNHIRFADIEECVRPQDVVLAQLDIRSEDKAVAVVIHVGVTAGRIIIVRCSVGLGLHFARNLSHRLVESGAHLEENAGLKVSPALVLHPKTSL